MRSFDEFMTKLFDHPSTKTTFTINGKTKTIKAMSRLTSKNYLEGEYIKIYFKEDGYLLIIPQDKEIYFSDTLQNKIDGIADSIIGNEETIHYQGRDFKLGNKDDYQFVKELIVGSPLDIEGECRFSDYFPTTGLKAFLSLGWLTYTNERADLYCEIIDPKNIVIV
jgi:hypothetical protein